MGGGGGAIPTPATTACNHRSKPPYPPTGIPDFNDQSEKMPIGYSNRTNFGPVPSQTEVQIAIADLRRVMNGLCATNLETMDQFVYDSSKGVMKSEGQKRLLDAYHLLQTDPLVQRLVLSISSDTRVWDAIMKNGAVQDLQGSLSITETEECAIGYKQEAMTTSIKWIFAIMKLKIMELIEKVEGFVFETLRSVLQKTTSTSKDDDDRLEDKVRSSLLLSIVILVIVVVTRSMET